MVTVPQSAFSSVDRIRTAVVLPAPLEPRRAKMLPRATSKSTPRRTCSCLNDFSRRCTRIVYSLITMCPLSCRRCRGGSVDGIAEALPLAVDPRAHRVVPQEVLDELHWVLTDDRPDRRAVGRALLKEVDEVLEHGHQSFFGAGAEVDRVPLHGVDRRLIVRGKLCLACLVLLVTLLLVAPLHHGPCLLRRR